MARYLTQSAGAIVEASTVAASVGAADAGKIPALGALGVLHSSMLPAGGGGASVVTVVVDMGSVPRRSRTFTGVAAPGVTAGQALVATVSLDMPGGLSPDELELDPVTVAAHATAVDTVNLTVSSPGLITGQRRINLIGA